MKRAIIAASLTVVMALPASAATFTDRFSSYYAFGDSLTDDGKIPLIFSPASDGFRFSNGPTYAEVVAQEFADEGLDTGNLAIGGATAGDANDTPLSPLSTFGGQIDTFDTALEFGVSLPVGLTKTPSGAPDPGDNPLISVLFGANDLFQSESGGVFPALTIQNAADAVATGIRELAALAGGLFDDFLVATLPDLGITPRYAGDAAAASAASDAFNERLLWNIDMLLNEGLNIYTFDSQAALQPLLDDIDNGGGIYGVTDRTSTCTGNIFLPFGACDNPDELLFIDEVHPNAVAQRLTGEAMIAQLAAIPLPATAPLILFGLAGLGFAGRRRRAA